MGQRGNSRKIPTQPKDVLNYMNFVRDRDGELFLYGRIECEHGIQSWGLFRYDAEELRWHAVGGYALDVIAAAEEAHPGWTDYLVRNYRGGRRVAASRDAVTFAWAWQPHFYNYIRGWGVWFGQDNRMHVRVPLRGLDHRRGLPDALLYAYSDDGGHTFYRADGSPVELPLTVNPSPRHNADVHFRSADKWWQLWLSLLSEAGYRP